MILKEAFDSQLTPSGGLNKVSYNEEMAHALNVPIKKVRKLVDLSEQSDALSLDALLSDDLIADPDLESVESISELKTLREKLEEVLDELPPRSAEILRRRFGLIDGQVDTLEKIAKMFGVGKEYIRQIESRALRKLRHSPNGRKLKDFL